ncbi:MAG: hypothetical protein FJ318_08155 [SAR202 cluster bacterium]|nr:hypothetical protein [SAR202 cluster bacterium]
MRTIEMEKAVREAFANRPIPSRIVPEGPVALADVLKEMEGRKAAVTLSGRAARIEGELVAQRAAEAWQ